MFSVFFFTSDDFWCVIELISRRQRGRVVNSLCSSEFCSSFCSSTCSGNMVGLVVLLSQLSLVLTAVCAYTS